MTVDARQHQFEINPALSTLYFQLLLTLLCALLLALMSLVGWVKFPVLTLLGFYALHSIRQFFRQPCSTLCYQTPFNQWRFNGSKVSLSSEQFITRNLVIVSMRAEDGRKLIQLIPADAMPLPRHIELRRLLIGFMANQKPV